MGERTRLQLVPGTNERWGGNIIVRTAAKSWTCHTYATAVVRQRHDGSPPPPAWATAMFEGEGPEMCLGHIQQGDQYVECTDDAPAFQSGSRYCENCARKPDGPLGGVIV